MCFLRIHRISSYSVRFDAVSSSLWGKFYVFSLPICISISTNSPHLLPFCPCVRELTKCCLQRIHARADLGSQRVAGRHHFGTLPYEFGHFRLLRTQLAAVLRVPCHQRLATCRVARQQFARNGGVHLARPSHQIAEFLREKRCSTKSEHNADPDLEVGMIVLRLSNAFGESIGALAHIAQLLDQLATAHLQMFRGTRKSLKRIELDALRNVRTD